MQRFIKLANNGALSLASSNAGTNALVIGYNLNDVLGDDVELSIAFFQQVANSSSLSDYAVQLTWTDTATDDVMYQVKGKLINDINDFNSILAIADATGNYSDFSMSNSSSVVTAIQASAAYNAYGTLGRSSSSIPVPADDIPDDIDLFDVITLAEVKPTYLTHQITDDISLFTTLLRAANKLDVPLYVELPQDINAEQAAQMAEMLDTGDHHVAVYWNPTLSPRRDATTLRSTKKTRSCLGVLLGYSLLRNARANGQGIPPIHIPIAGHDFPMPWRGIEMRSDIKLNEQTLNMLAKAKVNVVQPIRYDGGVRFVFGDCLTQYNSKTSALRLTNAADIDMFTTDVVVRVINRHMLKPTDTMIEDADRDCRKILDACYSAGLIKASKDLNGAPYVFSLTPHADRPFDAVDVSLATHPEGATRAGYLTKTLTN